MLMNLFEIQIICIQEIHLHAKANKIEKKLFEGSQQYNDSNNNTPLGLDPFCKL